MEKRFKFRGMGGKRRIINWWVISWRFKGMNKYVGNTSGGVALIWYLVF